ncbi:hypothetical protein, partial [Thermogutta sp.]|uniref:hypothetical protein n=1 Tax=Thermogutta sp. TaxID=1962930 RepID=UPI003C7E05CF
MSSADGKILEIVGRVLDGQVAGSYYQARKTKKSLMPAPSLRVLRVGDSDAVVREACGWALVE